MEVNKRDLKSKCKVAMIEPVGGHGGMDYYDFGLCEGLAASGVDVVLHTCDETLIPEYAGFEVRHTYAGVYGSEASWKRGCRFIWGSLKAAVSAILEGQKICHFHFFHVGILETFNVGLAKLCFRKVVITAHDVESFVESLSVPKLARWVYRRADGVIAHNQISKRELMAKLDVAEKIISVIPHGNYLHMLRDMPSRDQARNQLEIPEGAKVLLFFGQIKDVKGLDLLLEAMPFILKKYPEAVLLIAGKPWKLDFSVYEKQMDKLGITASCLKHIRYIPDEEVAAYYASCDLVALPYRRIYQSGVVLMTMSYGKAVLVSDLEGMREVVTDNKTGFVFKAGDSQDLATKLNIILENNSLCQTVANQGLEHVRAHYGWNEIGEKTDRLYRQVLS